MDILRKESELLDSNMYLIKENDHVIIIDPCQELSIYEEQCCYDLIILTHEHYDHISGVNLWKKKTGAKVLCSCLCAENIKNPKKNMSHHFDVFYDLQNFVEVSKRIVVDDYICEADETFNEQTNFIWQGHSVKLYECPGHSKGSILIIIDGKYLFSGDSILKNYLTECRFPGGSKKDWETIGFPLIKSLDNSMEVYPGHFESFKLKDKRWE